MRLLIATGILLISGASVSTYSPIAPDSAVSVSRALSQASKGNRPANAHAATDARRMTVHVVRMLGDERGYRFEPANLTIQRGDSVRFVMVSGGPHNIAFDTTAIPAGSKAKLSANLHSQITDMMGPMLLNADEAYTMSFDGLPAGAYPYYCVPHLAMNQRGVITVR